MTDHSVAGDSDAYRHSLFGRNEKRGVIAIPVYREKQSNCKRFCSLGMTGLFLVSKNKVGDSISQGCYGPYCDRFNRQTRMSVLPVYSASLNSS